MTKLTELCLCFPIHLVLSNKQDILFNVFIFKIHSSSHHHLYEALYFNTIHYIISSLIVINAFMLLILIVFIIIYSTAHFCFYKYSHCIKILFILWIKKFTLILLTDAFLMKVLFKKKKFCMIIFHVVVHDIFNCTDVTVDLICDYLLLFFLQNFLLYWSHFSIRFFYIYFFLNVMQYILHNKKLNFHRMWAVFKVIFSFLF